MGFAQAQGRRPGFDLPHWLREVPLLPPLVKKWDFLERESLLLVAFSLHVRRKKSRIMQGAIGFKCCEADVLAFFHPPTAYFL